MNNFKINIDDIENAPEQTLRINFEEIIGELNSKTPIKATLEATSLGEFIEITGEVHGSVVLECDLCLDEFDYNLDFEVEELFAKNSLMEEYGDDTELKDGQFVTDLKGNKEIDIYDLLYQSVILDLPYKKVCGINCKGNRFENEETFAKNEVDPRLAVFKDIKINGKR